MSAVQGKWILPPEVHEIASEFRAAAERIRAVYQSVNSVGNRLDDTWIGNAKNIFDAHFNSFPREIAAYAERLDQMAHEISQIQVWVPDETTQEQ